MPPSSCHGRSHANLSVLLLQLSESGERGKFHKAPNPLKMFGRGVSFDRDGDEKSDLGSSQRSENPNPDNSSSLEEDLNGETSLTVVYRNKSDSKSRGQPKANKAAGHDDVWLVAKRSLSDEEEDFARAISDPKKVQPVAAVKLPKRIGTMASTGTSDSERARYGDLQEDSESASESTRDPTPEKPRPRRVEGVLLPKRRSMAVAVHVPSAGASAGVAASPSSRGLTGGQVEDSLAQSASESQFPESHDDTPRSDGGDVWRDPARLLTKVLCTVFPFCRSHSNFFHQLGGEGICGIACQSRALGSHLASSAHTERGANLYFS